MLKNDIEKTLQAHKPVPPEGFAERTDYKVMTLMQKQKEQTPAKKKSRYRKPVLALAVALVLCFVTAASRDLIIRPDKIRAREIATPLVTALSEGKGEETGTGTEVLSGDEIDALEVNFPGIAGELRPVNLSCEKQGIRMEVISALKKENEAWIVYSLQDLEGDRVTRLTSSYDDIFGTGEEGGFSSYLSHNEAEHKFTAVYYTGPINQELPEDASYPFRVEDVSNARQEKLDILPYLMEYGKASEGVEIPDDAIVYSQSKVLDSTEPLNICLAKDFYLTGIGWIDNQLHVQIQDRQQERITIGPATVSPMVIGVAALYAEKPEKEVATERAMWSSAGDEYRDMSEFILGIRPEEADKIKLEAWTYETTDIVRDTWEVQIPLAGILMTTAEPAAREEETDVSFCLWRFFSGWAAGNTVYVENALTFHTEPDYPDGDEAAKEIMASGTPRGIKLHGVSGTKNDPVRTLDVTVQWDAEDGVYRYTRYALEFRMQKDRNGNIEYAINPESFKNGLTAEAIPDADLTLVTEAEMIREVMDAHVEEVAYDELTPIGLSTEKQGIRMEVVSGCRKGDDVYFFLTTQDLNGKYSEYESDPMFVSETKEGDLTGLYTRLHINRTENKTTWLYRIDLSKAIRTENNAVRAGIRQFYFREGKEVDLLPLLEQYGTTTEGITLPENYTVFTFDGKRAENGLKVLSDEGSLDVHLEGNDYLSAIGWIEDQLHVQLVRKNEKLPDPAYNDLRLFINCNVTGKPYEEIKADGSPVSWFNSQNATNREEYVFNCTPEDVDSMMLYGYGSILRTMLQDDWTVEVPLDLLPDLGAGAEPAAREEETEAKEDSSIPRGYSATDPMSLMSQTCEQDGIRLTARLASFSTWSMEVIYSIEVLAGNRNAAGSCFPEAVTFMDPFLTMPQGITPDSIGNWQQEVNEAEQKAVYGRHYFYENPVSMDNSSIRFGFDDVRLLHQETVDLTNPIRQNAKDAEGAALPDGAEGSLADGTPVTKENTKILSSAAPLNLQLYKDLYLNGVGWLDDGLHVQFVNRGAAGQEEVVLSELRTTFPGGEITWQNEEGSWKEYILSCTRTTAEAMTASGIVKETVGTVKGHWEVEFPMDDIIRPAYTDEETSLLNSVAAGIPDLSADDFIPLNIGVEKQGIRKEVSAACVKGDTAYILFTAQGVGEKEKGYKVLTTPWSYVTSIVDPSLVYNDLYGDLLNKKSAWLEALPLTEPIPDSWTFVTNEFLLQEDKAVDLLPLLKEYGRTEDGVTPPEGAYRYSENGKLGLYGMKMLSYEAPLDLPLLGDYCLSGIGWIDGQLHVQFHITGDAYIESPDHLQFGAYSGWLHSLLGKNLKEPVVAHQKEIIWDEDNDGYPDWIEFVVDIAPEDEDQMELRADVKQYIGYVQDVWNVEVPTELLLQKDATETAAPAA